MVRYAFCKDPSINILIGGGTRVDTGDQICFLHNLGEMIWYIERAQNLQLSRLEINPDSNISIIL